MKFFRNLFLTFFIPLLANGEDNSEFIYHLTPYIRNIPKTEYKGANQSWCIEQARDGYIYVANRLGLLEFDGSKWNLNSLNSSQHLVAVLPDDDRIYYAQFEEFGFFERDSYGVLQKTNLSDSLNAASELISENIWYIDKIGSKIYFRSFGKLFVYDGRKIEVVAPKMTIFSLFEYNGKPCANILDEGLFYLNSNNAFEKINIPQFLVKKRILNILPLNQHEDIIITEFNGIFLKKGTEIFPWNCPANQLLKDYQISKIETIAKDLIVFGTIGNGLIIINRSGEIIHVIDKESGLQNNTVLALLVDYNNNIWVGLNNGIDYIKINSPFLFCDDKTGQLGAIGCTQVYKNKLYIGSNQGLFVANWNKSIVQNQIELHKIPEVQGQVWEMKVIQDKLFCNYNLGLLQIDETGIKRIGEIGGFTVITHPNHDNIIYQGNYTGVQSFVKDATGNWVAHKWLHESIGGARSLFVDPFNNLWVSGNFKNVEIFGLNDNCDSILTRRTLDEKDGFDPDWHVEIFSFENRIGFINNGKKMTFDYVSGKLVHYDWLDKNTGDFKFANLVEKTENQEYWFLDDEKYGKFVYTGDTLILSETINLKSVQASVENDRQNIVKNNNQTYILGIDNGFLLYNSNWTKTSAENKNFPIKLTDVHCTNRNGKEIIINNIDKGVFEIPYVFRQISLYYAVPGMLPQDYSILYGLEGREWIDNEQSKTVSLGYLPQGNNKLTVKAINVNGDLLSETTTMVKILSPWYFSIYAFMAYLVLFSGIFYSILKILQIRLKMQKLAYLKEIKAANSRRIIKMKNQHLTLEIQTKSAQLVNYTLLLKNKNEILLRVKEILDRYKSNFDGKNQAAFEIYRIIDQNLSDKKDWKMFNTHFDEAHSNFLKKIKSIHETLTQSDLKLCAFLKMNLSSKEIASLLNISVRSVEVKRYRLRQKLDLHANDSLAEYIMSI